MRNLIVRALNGITNWLDSQNERVLGRRAAQARDAEPANLCPDCIFVRDDAGNIIEVIDCQTFNHQSLGG